MFQEVYTVFAGGDDLFLIGPWNVMAPLVSYLAEQFQKYVCENPAITFSAGISVHKPHVPVDKLARAAEESLEHSKNTKRKNSITMFGQTVSRDTFDTLLKNREEMESWLRKKYISKAMMYRFNHLITLAEKEKAVKSGNAILMEDMEAMKWRALFHYSIERNINSSFKDKKREQAVQDLTLMAKWMDQYGGGVRIPLWHLLYDKR
jgi:CRISPR-associated protein Csm1